MHNCFVVNQVLLIKALLSKDGLYGPSTITWRSWPAISSHLQLLWKCEQVFSDQVGSEGNPVFKPWSPGHDEADVPYLKLHCCLRSQSCCPPCQQGDTFILRHT